MIGSDVLKLIVNKWIKRLLKKPLLILHKQLNLIPGILKPVITAVMHIMIQVNITKQLVTSHEPFCLSRNIHS